MRISNEVNKYGRPVNRRSSLSNSLMMFPQHLTDIIVGPHKCGDDKSSYPLPGQQKEAVEPFIDMEFQKCLSDYRSSRSKWSPITFYGSLVVALYGVYWLGTKNKK